MKSEQEEYKDEREEIIEGSLVDAMRAEFNGMPWYVSSMAIHAVLFLLLMMLPVEPRQRDHIQKIEFAIEEPVEPDEDDPVEKDDPKEDDILDKMPVEINTNFEQIEIPEITEISELTPMDEDVEQVTIAEGELMTDDDNPEILDNTPIALLGVGSSGNRAGSNKLGRPGGGDEASKWKSIGDGPGGPKPKKVTDTVTSALRWLSAHQEEDGHWSCATYGGGKHDAAVTGLAVLAFLADGHSTDWGKYKRNVRKALEWLIYQQDESGRIGPHRYEAAFPAMALAEAYAMCTRGGSWKKRLKKHAQMAVDYAVKTQCPAGGWDYDPCSLRNDTSVSGWWIMALKSAKVAELDVPYETMNKALEYVKSTTTNGGSVSYAGNYPTAADIKAGGGSNRMSAVSLTCQIFLGEKRTAKKLVACADKITPMRLDPAAFDFYMWYYQGLGLIQMGQNHKGWKNFIADLEPAVLKTQIQLGTYRENRGSWNPESDQYGPKWGRVGQTAIGSLMLSVFWRYRVSGA